MKKCDVKGCKEKAVWFSKTESLCIFHYQDKVRESYEKEAQPNKIDVVQTMDRQEHEEFLDEYYPREEAKR